MIATEPPAKEVNETRNNSTPSAWQLMPMYETLIGIDNNTGQRTPGLATAWKVEPDGMSYRFTLRKGVQFHKGFGEFTANDLRQPWQEILKPDSISGVNVGWRDFLQDIEVVNDYEVIYHLKRPDGNFLTSLSRFRGGMEIFSKADFDRVRELIYKHAGISLHDGKHAMVYIRLSRRLRETGQRSFYFFTVYAQQFCNSNSCNSVFNIMHSTQMQLHIF